MGDISVGTAILGGSTHSFSSGEWADSGQGASLVQAQANYQLGRESAEMLDAAPERVTESNEGRRRARQTRRKAMIDGVPRSWCLIAEQYTQGMGYQK